MMAADEEGTLAALKAHRNETDPIVLNHGGRIVKGTGDGVLVEFPSAVEAVRAAVETQRLMAERNATAPVDRRMQYRIGINLGDVIVDDDGDIYGDGVNIAARLEAAADPGGVCVSGSIYRQVHSVVDVPFETLGGLTVKNIPDPVEAWRLGTFAVPGTAPLATPSTYALPSIAVLPFENLSADPEQEYFVDGLVEDLITALSRDRDLRIISRNSTFAHRGRIGDVRDTARELDATYVVEGSARRAGNRVRITAQLIEAETGHHVWADRYDREVEDIFAVQDELVHEIAGHIHPNVERVIGEKLGRARPDQLGAWDLAQRAKWHAYAGTRAGTEEAIRLLEMAARRDPELPLVPQVLAYTWMAAAFNSLPGAALATSRGGSTSARASLSATISPSATKPPQRGPSAAFRSTTTCRLTPSTPPRSVSSPGSERPRIMSPSSLRLGRASRHRTSPETSGGPSRTPLPTITMDWSKRVSPTGGGEARPGRCESSPTGSTPRTPSPRRR